MSNKYSTSTLSTLGNVNNFSILPIDGLSRFQQFKQFCPCSREKFRQLVNLGKAPQPIRLSSRMTCYANKELHKFFADPLNYRVEVVK